jgi:hypothetical protein
VVCGDGGSRSDSVSGGDAVLGLAVPVRVQVLRAVEIMVIWGCLLAVSLLSFHMIACSRSLVAEQTDTRLVVVRVDVDNNPVPVLIRDVGGFVLFVELFWGSRLLLVAGFAFRLPRCTECIARRLVAASAIWCQLNHPCRIP